MIEATSAAPDRGPKNLKSDRQRKSKIFDCEKFCGFQGIFAEVVEHEKNCRHEKGCSASKWAEIDPPQLAKDIPVRGM